MFSWTRQRSRSRTRNVVEFSEEDKVKFRIAKNAHISTKCPIPIEEFMKIIHQFVNSCGVFCFEKAYSMVSDFKRTHLGPPISPSNPYVLILNLFEQLANCDRKYYILSYLENNDVTITKPLKISYAALLKLTNIIHRGFLGIQYWIIVRLLREVQAYIKARMCAINLYEYMVSVANDVDIDWKEITERGQSIITFLLNDCKKKSKKGGIHWDTDSDIEHLRSTLDFLPVQEVIHEAEAARQERRKERQNEKKREELLRMLEIQKQTFHNQLKHRKLQSVRKLGPQKEDENQPSCSTKPPPSPSFKTGWSSGSSSSSRMSSAVGSDNSDVEDNPRVKKSSLKNPHGDLKPIKVQSNVSFGSNSSIVSVCSTTSSSIDEDEEEDSVSSYSAVSSNTSTSNLMSIIREQQRDHIQNKRKIKQERLSDEKHPSVHLKNSYVHRVIDSFDKKENLAKLSIDELKEKFEINLDLMECEVRKLKKATKAKAKTTKKEVKTRRRPRSRKASKPRKEPKSQIEQEIRKEAELEREELIWFKEAVERHIRLVCRESKLAKSPWWKRLQRDIECSDSLKNLPDNSPAECAARFLHNEKYLGLEGGSKTMAEEVTAKKIRDMDARTAALRILVKRKILERRAEMSKKAETSKKPETGKLPPKSAKAKNIEEGAYYIESSEYEEDENIKKSFVFQKLRRLFAHEMYTLMLIFETQYNLSAGNMVRCVAYINQLSYQFDFLSCELEAIHQEPETFFSFRKPSVKPRNNLIHWFTHVYQLLQAKLCLYATDVFGPSCLTLKDYKDIQKYDNGYNFIERCVEFTQLSQAFFFCICVGGRNRISEKDSNFEASMVLPEYGMKLRNVEKHYEYLLNKQSANRVMQMSRVTRERIGKPTELLLQKHGLDFIFELGLPKACEEIQKCPTLSAVEKQFLSYSIRYDFLNDPQPLKPLLHRDDPYVPILFRLPSPINSELEGTAMVTPEYSEHAFQLTSVFVRQHLHPKCVKWNNEMLLNRKSFRFVRYDNDSDKTFFGEAIERDLYMVIIYAGKKSRWDRQVVEFLNDILPELRCSNSLKLLTHAATTPELGVRGRVPPNQE